MKKFWRIYVLCVLALTSLSQAVLAFVAEDFTLQQNGKKTVIGQRVLRPELQVAASNDVSKNLIGENIELNLDAKTKQVRLLRGQIIHAPIYNLKTATLANYNEVARDFLNSHSGLFANFSQYTLILDEKAGLRTEQDYVLKYRFQKDGLLVQDASLDFFFQQGNLVQVINNSFSEARADHRASAANLKQSLASALDATYVRHVDQVYRVVPTKDHYQLIKADVFEVEKSGELFDVQVESATGRIYQINPRNHYMDGRVTGQVYNRYYNEELVSQPFSELNLKTKTTPVLTDSNGVFSAAADSEPALKGLAGKKADVRTETGTLISKNASVVDGTFALTLEKDATPKANDPMMAQAMVFYHTNLMVNFAKRYLDVPWLNEVLVANTNLRSTCNAHWDGSTINFYSADSRCANTGLISDVVYHEWGHGLDHNTGGIEDGAYSEGFGDIMSLVMTGSHVLGIGFKLDGGAVRDLSPDKIYPRDTGEVHAEGLIIGSTFYDLLVALQKKHGPEQARDLLAKFAFKSITTASRYTDVYNSLVVFDDDDANPATTSVNFCALNEVFAAHGLTTTANACLLGTLSSVNLQEVNGNGNGVMEPGETLTLSVNYLNNTGINISQLSAVGQVTPAVSGITLSGNAITWNEVANNTTQRSNGVLRLEIADTVACGTSFGISFNMESREPARNAVQIQNFAIGKNVGTAEDHSASGLPVAIPDEDSTEVPLTIEGTQWDDATTVGSANLSFNIKHTYIGDIKVNLVTPSGEKVLVFEGNGSDDDAHFNQDISNLVSGKLGKGTWKLEITDNAMNDVGTLEAFSLKLLPNRFICEN